MKTVAGLHILCHGREIGGVWMNVGDLFEIGLSDGWTAGSHGEDVDLEGSSVGGSNEVGLVLELEGSYFVGGEEISHWYHC
ncbi:hypothetical protein LINGRAHAP2_LOCUS8542 [Linum grandiflorum]